MLPFWKSLESLRSLRPLTTTTVLAPAAASQPPNEDPDHRIITLCTPPSPNPDAALRLLHRLHPPFNPSPSALSSIILSLCSYHRFLDAHRRLLLFLCSPSLSFNPSPPLANSLLARLLDSRSTPHLTLSLIHHLSLRNPGFVPTKTIYNRLIDQFSFRVKLSDARMVLDTILEKGVVPNVVSCTPLINGYVRNGQLDDAYHAFGEMCKRGVKPNSFTLSVLVRGVLRRRSVEERKVVKM